MNAYNYELKHCSSFDENLTIFPYAMEPQNWFVGQNLNKDALMVTLIPQIAELYLFRKRLLKINQISEK